MISGRAVVASVTSMVICAGVAGYAILVARPMVGVIALLSGVTIACLTIFRLARSIDVRDDPTGPPLSDRVADSRLAAENRLLRATNADLRAVQAAIAQGFDLVDDLTAGELRLLVERAGGDLVSLVDESVETDAEWCPERPPGGSDVA